MDWKHLLAYITGTVEQALLLRNEYLVIDNRILRHQITGRVRLTDGERTTAGRDRPEAREASAPGSGQHCHTRHHSRLAPQTRGEAV